MVLVTFVRYLRGEANPLNISMRIGLGEGKRKSGSQAFLALPNCQLSSSLLLPEERERGERKKLIKPKKGKFKKKNSKFHVKPKAKHVLRHARSSL
ncbi:hypothetical protein CISIN_1g034434mg [Citrus sinensis]|uniref:Uncharacterized protein n=1 Tax=Citrus sinensis TaxID=2711 RepID=A0A067G608_CITSI|nr:hypothetical protein CISIN_1g034434mg [Citrus sinensis]